MKKYNVGISVILIAVAIYIIKTGAAYNESNTNSIGGTAMGPGAWPIMLGVCLIILSVVLLIQTLFDFLQEKIRNRKGKDINSERGAGADEILTGDKISSSSSENDKNPIHFRSAGMIRVYIVVAMLAAFVVVMKFLGFYIAMALLIPGVLLVLGEKKWWKILAMTAGIEAFVFLVFRLLLSLKLPVGLLFKSIF